MSQFASQIEYNLIQLLQQIKLLMVEDDDIQTPADSKSFLSQKSANVGTSQKVFIQLKYMKKTRNNTQKKQN